MIIISSTELRMKYQELSDTVKETGKPIFITKNGKGDTVLLSMETYNELVKQAAKCTIIPES